MSYRSPAARRIVGFANQEVLGQSAFKWVHPDDLDHARKAFIRLASEPGSTRTTRYRLQHKNGGWRWIEAIGTNLLNDPAVQSIVINYRDISEQKQAEEVLRESEEKFRLIAERITEVFYLVNIKNNQTLYVSPGFEQVWGMPRSEVEKSPQNFMQAIHPDDLEHVKEGLRVMRAGLPYDLEYRIIRPDGVIRWIWDRGYSAPSAIGTVDRYVGVAQDITERKRAEDKLAASEAELRALFAAMQDAVLIIDNEGIYRKIAPTNLGLLYRPLEELLGKSLRDVFPPEDADKFLAVTREVVRTHQTQQIEYQLVINERPLWFSASITPLAEDSTVWVARDITERKTAEEALRKSEAQLSNAMKIANLGHWELDVASGMFTFTDNFYAIFRTNASEMGGYQMSVSDYARRFVPPEEGFIVEEEIRKGVETNDPNFNRYLEHRMLYADGSVGHIAVRFFIVKDDKGRTIKTYGINQDITERKRAEEALRASEEKFRALNEHGSEAILLIDAQGTIFFGNPAAQQLLGHSPQEFLGRSGLDDVHPDDLEQVREFLARLVSEPGLTQRLEYRLRHKDGTWRWVDTVATNSLHVPAVHGIVLNSRDITERKQAEAKIQEQLERLTALREVDQAIASIFDVQVSLNLLLSRAIHLLAMDAAAVLLLNPYQNVFEYKVGIGFHTDAIQNARLELGTSLAGRVALERRMVEFRSGSDEPENQHLADYDYLRGENFASYHGAPLVVKGKVIGVLEVFSRSFAERDRDWLDFFNTLAGQAAILIDSAKLFNDLQASNLELSIAYDATIEGWSRALDLRDKETEGHTRRVTELTMDLARQFGFPEDELIHIRRGALLHDIGKLGVPDHILWKAEALTESEAEIMKKHPVYAYELLSPIRYLKSAAIDIPYCHHEKWDGTGYPRGLKGEQIPFTARMFAVVDVWDALTSDRPYRKAWPESETLTYIREQAGKHFDPQVVDAFLALIDHDMANEADTGKNSN